MFIKVSDVTIAHQTIQTKSSGSTIVQIVGWVGQSKVPNLGAKRVPSQPAILGM